MHRPFPLLLALVVVAGCSSGSGGAPTTLPVPQATPGSDGVALAAVDAARLPTTPSDASESGAAVNAFGLDLYRRLAADDPGANLVLSPASIALALAMARAGARGTTADEMDAVLHGFGSDATAGWIAALDTSMLAANETVDLGDGTPAEIVLRSVNAPFAQDGLALEEAYLRALAERFAAGLRLVDYAGNPEGSRGVINGWVAEQTEQRIPELLAEGTITPDTRLALVNAIYLNAPWAIPFDPGATADAPFATADGSTMDVPMMRRDGSMAYAEGAGWRAVDLPYLGDRLAMLVVVPDDLARFEAGLDGATLDEIVGALESRQVSLALPAFGTESALMLDDALQALGMRAAFDAADFSGITREAALFIAAVVHQANIDVDERGTEAAAATAVVMAESAAPVPDVELRVDRPFLFALRDLATGAVVFLGRVTAPGPADPTAQPG
jgi:serpin B